MTDDQKSTSGMFAALRTLRRDSQQDNAHPLRPMAELCRRALNLVPGVAG